MQVYSPARDEMLELATQPLAAGGEGRVFPIRGYPTLLAKIFDHPAADNRREKVTCLIAHPFQNDSPDTADGHRRLAMPQELLFDAQDKTKFVGYLMPRIPKSSVALHEYFDPGSERYRRDKLPLRVALAIAVAELVADAHAHHLMLVLGDINYNNILADDFGRAALIDLDSCQLTTVQGTTYHCTVASPDYKAPELFGKDLHTLRREQSSDLFGLAVLIWQLVTQGGKHPFAATNDVDLVGRIRRGDFAYVLGAPHSPPPDALPLSAYPDDFQNLAIRAFVDGRWNPAERPAADVWADALRENQKALSTRPVVVASMPLTTAPAPATPPAARGSHRTMLAAVAAAAVTAVVPSLLPAGWRLAEAGIANLVSLAAPTPAVRYAGVLDYPPRPPADVLPRGPEHRRAETPAYWRRLRDGDGDVRLSFETPKDLGRRTER